jgi:adenylosuccinate synthase
MTPPPQADGGLRTVTVVGVQWGDEGKGKVVDLLSEQADIIVRFHGGHNAGHTLVVGGERMIVHVVPAGVLHRGKVCVIGNGVVVDPGVLLQEIAALRARGHLQRDEDLRVSEQAHVVMPYHRAIDLARERRRGSDRIGTTGRGIGPAYEDKMARVGIRLVDLLEPATFRECLARNLDDKNLYLRAVLGEDGFAFQEVLDEYTRYAEALRPFVGDTAHFLEDAIAGGKRVLFEGAQGAMLDIDHGTYPFVTSSTTLAGGVAAGAGIATRAPGGVVGICKAYTTRVGSGPFPTELNDATGDKLRQDGGEYGATTGRPRRCGWFDAVVVREAVRLNGLTSLAVTKLDVLRGLPRLRLCVEYRLDGAPVLVPPASAAAWNRLMPVYAEMDGWTEDLSGVRDVDGLPPAARRYVARLEELAGVPLSLVSVGAGREETIVVRDPYRR